MMGFWQVLHTLFQKYAPSAGSITRSTIDLLLKIESKGVVFSPFSFFKQQIEIINLGIIKTEPSALLGTTNIIYRSIIVKAEKEKGLV